MKSTENWKVSFREMSLKNRQILAQQSEISFVHAIQQIQRLKKTSKVNNSLKKSRVSS
ncbi:MAG: hypothetical protein MUE99_12215 [Chitinophagaceae bacterium]|nr:hypothetical protein [Chitinophagaceae bacterium]